MPTTTELDLLGNGNIVRIAKGSSQVLIHRFGATIVSWTVDGQEQLFLSTKANLDGSTPIRGGIPVVFPQFGQGPIMSGQHGFARNQWWTVEVSSEMDKAVALLTANEKTMELWPYSFKLEYTIQILTGETCALETTMRIINPSDSQRAFEFTTLLHSYFRVDDIGSVTISGLKGLEYIDKLGEGDGRKLVEERKAISIDSEIDRIYWRVDESIHLQEKERVVSIDHSFPDIVVWNPWIEKAKRMTDFGDEEYKHMVCLEVGAIGKPTQLAPGQDWIASQRISTRQVTFNTN